MNGERHWSAADCSSQQTRLLPACCLDVPVLRCLTVYMRHVQAEVTGGGVPLSEVDCSSMESRLLPGVFLCGEILDVFGRIGGFNFYWAWVSGRLAGLSVASRSHPPSSNGT